MCKLKLVIHQSILGVLFFIAQGACANPVLEQVKEGIATVIHEPNKTTVHQVSEKAVLHWDSFNIGAHEATHFQQPQGGIALNRINANNGISQIYGRLTATGQIILINGAGIHFGPGSYVNVGRLIVSTSDISNENFRANKYVFDRPSVKGGKLINHGHIKAADYGLVAFVGPHIENHGLIEANMGTVALGAGNKATLDFHGNDLIHFAVEDNVIDSSHPQVKNRVKNTGKIYADGGKILVHASSASRVLDSVINMKGVAVARSVEQRNGKIILHAGSYGKVKVAGRLDASGRSAGSRGGKIKLVGRTVKIKAAELDVSGHSGGGKLVLGSESAKPNTLITAEHTQVLAQASLNADALVKGQGGQIIIHSKDETLVQGKLSAQGGSEAGDGGFIETNSGRLLNVDEVETALQSVNGLVGTWSLEAPKMFVGDNKSAKAKLRGKGDAQFSSIDTNTLQDNLVRANVTVKTGPTGSEDHYSTRGHLSIDDSLTWHSPNTLTLSAYRNIDLMLNAVISNDAGGSLVLKADNAERGEGGINFMAASPQIQMKNGGSVLLYHNSYGNSSAPVDYSKQLELGQGTRFVAIDNNYYKNPASYESNELALSDVESENDFSPVGSPTHKRGLQDAWILLSGESDFKHLESLSNLSGLNSQVGLSDSGVHLSQDLSSSFASGWDSLASLDAAYQNRGAASSWPQASSLLQSQLSDSREVNAYLTQSLEPTVLPLNSPSLSSLASLLNEHPSLMDSGLANNVSASLVDAYHDKGSYSQPSATFAVLPAPTLSVEPTVIQQPLNENNQPKGTVWSATPWQPAASGVSLSRPAGPPGGPVIIQDEPVNPSGPPGGAALIHDEPAKLSGPPGGPALIQDEPVNPEGPPGGPSLMQDTPQDPEKPLVPHFEDTPDVDTVDSPTEPVTQLETTPVAGSRDKVAEPLPCLEIRQRLDTPGSSLLSAFDQESDLLQCPPL